MRRKVGGGTVPLKLDRVNLFSNIYFLPMILNSKATVAEIFFYFFVERPHKSNVINAY